MDGNKYEYELCTLPQQHPTHYYSLNDMMPITVATVKIWQRYGYFKGKAHVAHHYSLQMQVNRIQPLGQIR
jgi:hypothetical protein